MRSRLLALIVSASVVATCSSAMAQVTQGIGVYGPEGWTVLRPSQDTKFIFVSSSEGNDANDGLSPERPKRTIDSGRRLARAGFPDWVLLKRGDVFEELFTWAGSGRSNEEPMVIGAYGDGIERPIVMPPVDRGGFYVGAAQLSFLAITGIEFRAAGQTGQTGIRIIADRGDGLLIEDCAVIGFRDNISIIGKETAGGLETVQIRRSVIADAASFGGGHSQGVYTDVVLDLTIEGCVIDHNGWSVDPPATATIFNHNLYLQKRCGPVVVRDNIIASGASHGLQARTGGLVEDNLFVRNALAMFVSLNESHVKNNVVLEGRDITASLPRGFGIEVLQIPAGIVEHNIIASRRTQTPGGYAFQLSRTDNGLSEMSVRISSNIVYDWPDIALKINDSNPALFREVQIVGNDFQDPGPRSRMVVFLPPQVESSRWEFENNEYWTGVSAGSWFRVGSTNGDMTWWRGAASEWNSAQNQVSYPDPGRTVASYWASLGESGGYEGFMQRARQQSRANWDPRVTAGAVNDYVRAGYGLTEAP